MLDARRLFALTISGTSAADLIVVSRADASLVVTLNGTTMTASAADAQSAGGILVNAGDGNDTIRVNGLGDVVATLNGEAGNDSISLGTGSLAKLLANVTVSGGVGADSLSVDDSLGTTADVIDISNPTNTFLTIAPAGSASIFVDIGTAASAVESVTISTSTVADTVNVSGTSSLSALTILSGDGDDSIHVGNDIDSNLLGSVAVAAGAGVDSLALDDSADAFGDTYSLGGSGTVGVLTKNSGGGAMSYSGVEALTLTAGVGGAPVPNNQQFRVSYLPTGTATTILAGSGDDALRIGDGVVDLATAINAPIFFDGGDDFDRVDYLDTVGSDSASYTVNPSTLDVSSNTIVGYAQLESLNVQANNASNFMRLVSTINFMNVTLNGGGGDDLFVVGNGDIDSTIANSVSVIGGAGYDNLFVDDSSDDVGNDTYTFSAGLLNRAQRAVLWSTSSTDAVEYVQLTGSPNNDTINVNGVAPLSHLRIDAGPGNDAILVARTTDGTTTPSAPVSIVSGTGRDTLDVNSDFSGSDATVELSDPAERPRGARRARRRALERAAGRRRERRSRARRAVEAHDEWHPRPERPDPHRQRGGGLVRNDQRAWNEWLCKRRLDARQRAGDRLIGVGQQRAARRPGDRDGRFRRHADVRHVGHERRRYDRPLHARRRCKP